MKDDDDWLIFNKKKVAISNQVRDPNGARNPPRASPSARPLRIPSGVLLDP